MKTKRILLAAALMALVVGVAKAQDDTRDALKSYSFVEAQGGLQLTSTNAKMDKLMTPTAALSFGHFFSPVIGVRLHVNGWQAKSGFSSVDQYYKWNYITPNIDMLLNLTNAFSSDNSGSHFLNVMVLAGLGLQYGWDNDEVKKLDPVVAQATKPWSDSRLSQNLRAGIRLETDVTKRLGFSLEVNANSISDRMNSKISFSDDWQFTAMLGISYRFSKSYEKPSPISLSLLQDVIDDQAANTATTQLVVAEKKEKKMVKKEISKEETLNLHKEAFYGLAVTNNSDNKLFEEVSKFLKEHKNAKITIVGYADKGTGNPKINKKYATERAENFKAKLVKDFGCDASAINTDSKGDTVQPFPDDNDKNRCVLIDGQGIRIYTETIEVEE